MEKIKTVYVEDDIQAFDEKVQNLMDEGYKLKNAFTGLHPYCGGTAAYQVFTAILVKEV